MPDQPKNQVTLRDVYDIVNSMRGEVISSVMRLETKLDNLESVRISKIETELEAFKTEMHPIKTVVWTLLIAVVLAVLGSIMALVLK